MTGYAVSITLRIEADSFESAYKIADEVVEQIEERADHAYYAFHWNIEEIEE